jgi:hypothetical protein
MRVQADRSGECFYRVRTLAIEINDSSLVVANETEVLAVEPGYALAERGELITGAAAYGQARLKPRQVSNRYWANLSLDPGSAGIDGAANAAELAFLQLRSLWQRLKAAADAVVFVVPGHYGREQLGLLLGLAEECGMPVRALVDAAVAASTRPYPGRQLVYVDAALHRVSVTPVEQTHEAVAEPEQGLQDFGLANATDLLARWVAEVFVMTTRFDPFHHAQSEQQLYDRLPGWLRELREGEEAVLTLPHRGEDFTVTVERDQLLGVVAGFNRAVVQLIAQARAPDKGLVVQLSERLIDLPGLAYQLTRLDDALVVPLPQGHAARSALHGLAGEPEGGPVRLLKHLGFRELAADEAEPRDSGEASSTAPTEGADGAPPTHVVYRGVGFAVDAEGLVIGRSRDSDRRTIVVEGQSGGLSRLHCELVFRDGELRLKDMSRYGTFVNEKRIAGEAVLHPADVIRIGSPGAELQVIRMEDSHGA